MEPILLSKTQKKKDALALQDLGKALVKLSVEQIKNIEMPEKLFQAVILAKKLTKHTALLRQMQHIGALMRKYDPAPIQEALQKLEQGSRIPQKKPLDAEESD